MKYDFNEEEVKVIVGLTDIALKSGGIQNLGAVNHILNKINAPLLEVSETEEPAV